jgi:alpha-ketoglutaric semialdehyde dehydrogenase
MITGEMLIGATASRGSHDEIRAVNPSTGKPMDPPYGGGSAAEVDRACALAWEAFDKYRELPLETRASFLE